MRNSELLHEADLLLQLNKACLDSSAFEVRHASFYNYTRLSNAMNLLAEQEHNYFWVSNLENMNDLDEKEMHKAVADRVYSLSFCNTKTENLPLWYLYGGIDGEGVRVGFRPTAMKEFLEQITCVYPFNEDGAIDRAHPLQAGKDFEIQMGWVYYLDHGEFIKYRGRIYEFDEEKDYEQFRENNYFIKRFSWNYEEEFRVVLVFAESVGPRIAIEFDKNKYVETNGIRIGFGPAYSNQEKWNEVRKTLKEKTGCHFKIMEKSTIHVNYDLFRINSEVIVNHFDEILSKFSKPEDKKKAWKTIKSVAKAHGLK